MSEQVDITIQLDTRICDVEEGATNTETYREFIQTSEREFGLERKDIDHFEDENLKEYLDFLDYLWTK